MLCDAPAGRGGSWSRDNVIVFAPSAPPAPASCACRAPAASPTVVTTLDPTTGETNHRWPHFLPDGRHFLYTASTGTCCPPTKPAIIRIGSLDPADAAVTLFQAESSALYASGHVLFARDDTLMAQPFDPDARQPKGDAFPLAEHVSTEGSRYMGASVSENGTLVYAPGRRTDGTAIDMVRSRGPRPRHAGRTRLRTSASRCHQMNAALPSGWEPGRPDNRDIWIIDIARIVRSRLTFDPGADGSPVWSPDGTRIAFAGQRSGKISLRQQSINGTAADESLLEGSGDFDRRVTGPQMGVSSPIRSIVGRHIRYLGPAVVRRSQTVSSGADRVQRDRRRVLSGWTVDRVHDQRSGPGERLRSTVSRGRREISGITGRRGPSVWRARRQGIVLPRTGRSHDGGADRREP